MNSGDLEMHRKRRRGKQQQKPLRTCKLTSVDSSYFFTASATKTRYLLYRCRYGRVDGMYKYHRRSGWHRLRHHSPHNKSYLWVLSCEFDIGRKTEFGQARMCFVSDTLTLDS